MRQAIEQYGAALAVAQELGDRRNEGTRLANLGLAYRDLGEPARARQCWAQALALYEAVKDPNTDRVRRWLADLEA